MAKYTNIYGEVYIFTKHGIDKVLMEGNFEYHRVGGEPDDIEYINPRGGPFIKKGQMLSHIIHCTSFNVIVETFESSDNGYIINVREIEVDPNDFSHLEDGNYIGGLTMSKYKSNYWKMEEQKPKSFLIKRSPKLTKKGVLVKQNYTRKGYSESGVRKPSSINLVEGDFIYVSETDYGIYAKGEVIEVWEKPQEFLNTEDIVTFFYERNDPVYCFELIKKLKVAKEKNPLAKLYYHEYFINQTLLDNVIPLEGELVELKKIQNAFSEIKNQDIITHINNPNLHRNIKISTTIPGALRQRLYSFFNQKYNISTWIDIDHFVPKSIGGPGNIIENLVPIGFSLNRYKSNSIPKGVFEVSHSYPELKLYVKKEYISEDQEMFLRSINSKEDAKKIISIVNSWEGEEGLDRLKKFYRSILKYHHPEYFMMINDL